MRRASRTRTRACRQKPNPTADQIRQYMQRLAEEHDEAWHGELMTAAPHWIYLINLHLRMVELEHMEAAVQEFL